MDYQSGGRNHKPKGTRIKQALQIILVLAVSVWLVYQIKHSTSNKRDQYGAVPMGRKGTPSLLAERALPRSGNVQFDGATEEQLAKDKGPGTIHVKLHVSVMKDSQSDGKKPAIGITDRSTWDGSNKEANAEDDDHKLREMQENAMETGADADVDVVGDGIFHSFRDENGVPPEENEEIISKFGKQSPTKDSEAQYYSQVSDAISEGDRSVL